MLSNEPLHSLAAPYRAPVKGAVRLRKAATETPVRNSTHRRETTPGPSTLTGARRPQRNLRGALLCWRRTYANTFASPAGLQMLRAGWSARAGLSVVLGCWRSWLGGPV